MKLINSFGPNPRMVRWFLIEKGIELEHVDLDLLGGENRGSDYVAKNPGGQMPALELDDGTVIAETSVICEYIEEQNPSPVLIGSTPEERANTRMWLRRVEQGITEHMYNGFRYSDGIEIFRDRLFCIPEAADGLKAKARDALQWLNGLMSGSNFIAGDKMTIADMVLFCCMDFAKDVGQPLDPELSNLSAWYTRMEALEGASKSLHPGAAEVGMQG
ncbi:MAG: glutathione S-transferase family protein [Proteobacteria bacterium]|jgi:glutathione S-transferase|nr:glutathione S-transferase family protein [Pseudomonadota bacterium]